MPAVSPQSCPISASQTAQTCRPLLSILLLSFLQQQDYTIGNLLRAHVVTTVSLSKLKLDLDFWGYESKRLSEPTVDTE